MTGRSIDWLRQKIGESGQIDTLGAWTESWTLRGREGRGEKIPLSLSFCFICLCCVLKPETLDVVGVHCASKNLYIKPA